VSHTARHCLLILAVCAGAWATGLTPEAYVIRKVRITVAPRLRNDRIMYAMDLAFVTRPGDYWAYYSADQNAVVVDIYGGTTVIECDTVPTNEAFKSVAVRHMSSSMTLSGGWSQIVIGADPGWHVESTLVGDDVIRLVLWRTPERRPPGKPKRWMLIVVVSTMVVAAGLGTFYVIRYFD
jgi:hypothetical protein